MQLHRPKDINSLNEDFFREISSDNKENIFADAPAEAEATDAAEIFSSAVEELFSRKETDDIPEIDAVILDNDSDITTDFIADQIEKLARAEFTNEQTVFHEIPFGAGEARSDFPDESEIFKSFPEVEFDPSMFIPGADPSNIEDDEPETEREYRKNAIKKARQEAKASIEEQKEIIKDRQKLEKEVQAPFSRRRTAVFCFIILLIAGIFLTAVTGIILAVDNNGHALKVGSGYIGYTDGESIVSHENPGSLFLLSSDEVQGSRRVLFYDDYGVPTTGTIIAIGEDIYGIDTGEKIYRVTSEKIIGIIILITPDLSVIYNAVTTLSVFAPVICAAYLLLVILGFAVIIRRINKKIRLVEDTYELV